MIHSDTANIGMTAHRIAEKAVRKIKDGDLVSLDLGLVLEGFWADMGCTVLVGNVDPEAARLKKITDECLDLAIAAAQPIDLKEDLGIGGDDLFDRLTRERRQSHRGAARGRGTGHRHLAVRIDRLHAGRRNHDRERDFLSHNRCRQVTLRGRADHVWRKAQFAERRHVVADGHPFLAGGDQGGIR